MNNYFMTEFCKDCLSKYCVGKNYLSSKEFLSHDGYDRFGPQSNLYDFAVLIERDGKILMEVFHREYWFHGEDDEAFYPFGKDIFSKDISKRLNSIGYYTTQEVSKLKSELNKDFTELVVDKILENIVENVYSPEQISLNNSRGSSKIYDGSMKYQDYPLYLKRT